MKQKYYNKIDIIRIISCVAVLLYHLNILKGGYLAVCTFFVLTGYLSIVSSDNKEKFSIKKYYLNILKQIYIPLLITVFLTISIVLILNNYNWINLKVETTSVLLGYNNFWQLNANLDYFTRHITSPFMHLWYISILLQFELIFPFLYIIIKTIRKKIHRIVPLIILIILSLISTLFFIIFSKNTDIMIVYYNTFYRIFSIILGLLLGYTHTTYKNIVIKERIIKDIIFYTYLIIFIYLMFITKSNSKFFIETMVLITIISCRLIDYATIDINRRNRVLSYFANLTYEIYLIQYPTIFIIQDLKIAYYLKIILTIGITILISILLKLIFSTKIEKRKIIIWIFRIPILIICIYGLFQFVISKDHTKEMKDLEKQLASNQEIMKQKQEEYAKRMKEEQETWNNKIDELIKNEENLKEAVKNLSIVGVGDSVLLGAIPSLNETFPNGYFDGGVSRTDWEANKILIDMKNRGILGDPILINLGTNGQCGESCRNEILQTVENRKVFWVNVTNDYEVHVNSSIEEFANSHDNVYMIDWNSASNNHKEYFVADGIHLTSIGMKYYAETIYNSIYQVYLNEFQREKEKVLKEKENSELNKISFYGNDLLLNLFNNLSNKYKEDEFNINSNYTYELLSKELELKYQENQLKNKIVFLFDNTINLTQEKYTLLLKYFDNKTVYIIELSDNKLKFDNKNIIIIPFYKEIQDDFIAPDKIHLTNKGNQALKKTLLKVLNSN